MSERPILFSAPMVRAILNGTKIQTRRIVKHEPINIVPFIGVDNRPTGEFGLCLTHHGVISEHVRCPYGMPGDRLWVREAWSADYPEVGYQADLGRTYFPQDHAHRTDLLRMYDRQRGRWRPSIHMPRWASRILLEISDVRVERLQDISQADALAEGVNVHSDHHGRPRASIYSPVQAYRDLWEEINGPESWDANPWVWVIEFRRVDHDSTQQDKAGGGRE